MIKKNYLSIIFLIIIQKLFFEKVLDHVDFLIRYCVTVNGNLEYVCLNCI